MLRDAVALDPQRPEYRLALGKALVVGRPSGGSRALRTRGPAADARGWRVQSRARAHPGASGQPGRGRERLLSRHLWSVVHAVAQPLRRQARLELIALYRGQGATSRLRAALLELSNAFPGDRELQLQAGRDLLAAGLRRRRRQAAPPDRRTLRRSRPRARAAGARRVRPPPLRGGLCGGRPGAGAAARDPRSRGPSGAVGAGPVAGPGPATPVIDSPRRPGAYVADRRARPHRGRAAADTPEATRLLATLTRWLARRASNVEVGRSLLQAAATRWETTCPPASETDAAGAC